MSSGHDKTVVLSPQRGPRERKCLLVRYPLPGAGEQTRTFDEGFVIGRDNNCQVVLTNDGISRRHLELLHKGDTWWVRDLGSSNGTFLNGARIREAPITEESTIGFFSGGPLVRLSLVESATRTTGQEPSSSHSASSAGEFSSDQAIGPRPAQRIRPGTNQTYTPVPPQAAPPALPHRRQFLLGMAAMGVLLIPAIGYLLLRRDDQAETREIAKQIFYETKALELQLSLLRRELAQQPEQPLPEVVEAADHRLRAMQKRYATFREEKKLIGGHRSKEDLLIFRIARIFGEYDLDIPDDFLSEVKRYIRRWQKGKRLADSVARIQAGGHAAKVAAQMQARGLPPHYIYVAVQESDFRHDAIGPRTRFGIAKGMWQFIPQTAEAFGLRVGPKKDQRVYDPLDERFNVAKATRAAAEYLEFIYTTEAQASGLLVMSAYNWGEANVIKQVLRRFPNNPAERNFWRLLEQQRIPDETYGYVLNIVSAAVIGEDPQYFGFEFENPLKGLWEG